MSCIYRCGRLKTKINDDLRGSDGHGHGYGYEWLCNNDIMAQYQGDVNFSHSTG